MLENLKNRRSIRKYKSEQIRDDHLDAILEAGLYAASGMNTQNTIMVAIRDKETRDQLSRMNAEVMGTTSDPFYGAPCVVVVLVEPERYTAVEDGSLVMGNLMLAAHACGLGSCWIHRAREVFEKPEWKDWLKKHGVEAEAEGIGFCIIGYADCDLPKAQPRREKRVFYVK
jgi:nitroreductase